MARYQDDSMDQPRGMMRRAPAPQQTAPMATRRTAGGVDAGEMGRPWNQTFSGGLGGMAADAINNRMQSGGAQPQMVRAGGGPAMTSAPQAPVAGAGGGTMGMGGMVAPAGAAQPGVAAPLPAYTGVIGRYNPNMAG